MRLEQENAALRQRLEASEARLADDGTGVTAASQRLIESEAAALTEASGLRNEVSQLRDQTNKLMTLRRANAAAAVALERERWQTEFFRLQDQYTGKPRVPRVGAWIGVGLGDLQATDAASGAAVVHTVVPSGPAEQAQIQPKDVIISVDDATVRNSGDFKALLAQKKGAQIVRLGVLRDGAQLAIDVHAWDWPQ
jgi:predicted metalloprotease with PDZ domain